MPVAMTLQKHLAELGIEYDVLMHPKTLTSQETAQQSHVPGDRIAKGVLLKDERGYLLAVVPATHHVRLGELREKTGRRLGLATEAEVAARFKDCEVGAIPPIGAAYGLPAILDDSVVGQADVYFEGGDHVNLVRVTGAQFEKLMANAERGRFSRHD
jgi:Ala-tRNA(Pro) deacylase